MTNHPQRALPKNKIKVDLDFDTYQFAWTLAAEAGCSLSSMVESVLLLSKLIYSQEADDAFVRQLRDIKADRFSSLTDLRRDRKRIRVHIMIDQEAHDFISMLRRTYHPVFKSAGETVSICLAWAAQCCETQAELDHFLRRLESTQLVFPVRKKKGTP